MRELLPLAEVIKHRDASMIGLPDCSITFNTHALWVEFKLYPMARAWEGLDDLALAAECLKKAVEESPTQASKVKSLHRASWALYVIWVKKTCVLVIDPVTLEFRRFKGSSPSAEWLSALLREWTSFPHPRL
jgi:hypothetical protein